MSQVSTIATSEVNAPTIGAENANPNTDSVVLLKAKDGSEENLICSENLRSESSTPVKETIVDQPAPVIQIAGKDSQQAFLDGLRLLCDCCPVDSTHT